METNIRIQILDCIGKVYEKSKGSELVEELWLKIDNELLYLSEYLHTTKTQAFLIALVFTLNYRGNTVDLKDLMNHIDCNPMKVLLFNDDLDFLHSKGILIKQRSKHHLELAGANDQYSVNEEISKAILSDKPMPNVGKQEYNNVLEFLEKIDLLMEQRYNDEITTPTFLIGARNIIDSNHHFPLVKSLNSFNLDIYNSLLFLYLIWKSLSGSETIGVERVSTCLFQVASVRVGYITKLLLGDNDLIKNSLVEVVPSLFFNDSEIKLTNHSLSLLEECGITHFIRRKKRDNVFLPKDVICKELYFSAEEKSQISILQGLLDERTFSEIGERFAAKGLPKGFTALLYGEPGTGKTELVKQLAKQTNRAIMKVEISQSKSMWYGESEKVVKRIFTDYATFAGECEQMPILFFNEADAIIGKRLDLGKSNVGQTENAIQNILLEELENFDGILLATTNLIKNMDAAFDRRFLFKIEFHKSNPEINALIWKSKLPTLTEKERKILAQEFNFSGAQIENIVRKTEIYEIMHGVQTDFNSILGFCKAETKEKKTKIGFNLTT